MAKWFHQTKRTVSLILGFALLLSTFVSGANYVAANSELSEQPGLYEQESVTTNTYGLEQATAASPVFKVIDDFEGGNVTASSARAKVNLDFASRPEPVLYGNHAAKLSYTFVDVESGTSAAYLNFTDPGTSNYRTLEGKPTKLGLWVYGDGVNKHWLRAEFNAAPNNAVADFTGSAGFNWSGWKYVVIPVPDKLTDPQFTEPITLRRIYITQINDANKTNGVAYFDRISVFYGDTGGLYGLDLLGLTPMKTGDTQTAQVFETREGYTEPQLAAEGVTFSSSDEKVAAVDAHGNVTAKSKGVTIITASYGGFDATYELAVDDDSPIVDQLYFTGVSELKMHETAQTELFASIRGVSEPVRILSGAAYASDNEEVASIDEQGLITAKSAGKTIIRASYGNQTAAFELGVSEPVPILQNIRLSGLTAIEIGESKQAKVIGTYNIEPLEIELKEGVAFTSSNPSVATVDSSGVVEGKSLGISVITAKYEGKNAVYTVVVNKPNLQPPKRELRAAWISTVERIDWPQSTDSEKQKQEFINLLDFHKSLGMNAVVVQIKPTADAFYQSELAPWSHWITGVQGKDPGYDPLAFMIEEAHKRNLEFHAWFNPYRISMNTNIGDLVENHPARLHPDWVMEYGGKLYYNPGVPEAIQYITDSVMEVVKNYDVDGVHFDDYFYPNRFDGEGYPDQAAYEQYGNHYPGGINAWRRNNVDTLIKNLSQDIKKEKSYVKFGISPFGVWRNLSDDPNGSKTTAGQPSYDNLHADIRKWVLEGWIDYVTPQIYWSFGFAPAAYEILVDWWNTLIEENNANTHLYIGHADYKVEADVNFTDPYEIPNQLSYNLNFDEVKGSIHFTTRDLLGKPELRAKIAEVYKTPSLVPVMPWLETAAPAAPGSIEASSAPDGIQLTWKDEDESTTYYVIYRVSGDQALDMNNPAHLLTTLRKGDTASYIDQNAALGETYTYAVTAVDRLHNESELSEQTTITAKAAASIKEVDKLQSIYADYGTLLQDLNLPKTVGVSLSSGTKANLSVTWDGGTPAYNGQTAGTYVFTGALQLQNGVLNPDHIQAQIQIIVKDKPVIVTEAAKFADLSVNYGTGLSDLKLPASVKITLSDGTAAETSVTWNEGVPPYDGNKAGTYVFTGILQLPEGVENPEKIEAAIKVTVMPSYSGGEGAVILPPMSTVTLKAGSAGTAMIGDEIWVSVPEGASDQDLQITIQKLISFAHLPMPENKLVSSVFELSKNFKDLLKKPVTITIAYDPSKVGEDQLPSIFYFDEDERKWEEIGGTAKEGKVTAEIGHFAKLAVFAVEKPVIESPACVHVGVTDIEGHWAKEKITAAIAQCVVNGYSDQTFRPDRPVSRAEFTVMLARALQLEGQAEPLAFTDSDRIGKWAQPALSLAAKAGIVKGYKDGSFRPEAQISRTEMAAMIIRALSVPLSSGEATSFADDADIPVWAKAYVSAAVQEGIIRGRSGNQFAPDAQATRAEAAVMLLRMLEASK